MSHFAGLRIIETIDAVERSEDWSRLTASPYAKETTDE
jgi:hypothetical protein